MVEDGAMWPTFGTYCLKMMIEILFQLAPSSGPNRDAATEQGARSEPEATAPAAFANPLQ